jgi:hypothetical protein
MITKFKVDDKIYTPIRFTFPPHAAYIYWIVHDENGAEWILVVKSDDEAIARNIEGDITGVVDYTGLAIVLTRKEAFKPEFVATLRG